MFNKRNITIVVVIVVIILFGGFVMSASSGAGDVFETQMKAIKGDNSAMKRLGYETDFAEPQLKKSNNLVY